MISSSDADFTIVVIKNINKKIFTFYDVFAAECGPLACCGDGKLPRKPLIMINQFHFLVVNFCSN